MWSRVRAWSWRFETKNKLNASTDLIMPEMNFIDFTCIKTHEKMGVAECCVVGYACTMYEVVTQTL